MAQQVTNTAAREEAEAQRAAAAAIVTAQDRAEKNARHVQREERELAAAQTRGLNDFKRQDPLKFSGSFDSEEADLWLQELDKIFTFLHTTAELRVNYATYMLTGEADARAAKEAQFLRLRQGGMTVAEYAAKLESLAKHFRYFRGQVEEGYMCERFVHGLSYELQRAVQPLGINRYQVLVEKTKGIEAIDNQREKYQGLNKSKQGSGGPTRANQCRNDKGENYPKKSYVRPQGKGTTSGSVNPSGSSCCPSDLLQCCRIWTHVHLLIRAVTQFATCNGIREEII
ncbi:uncharacterized protein LOC130712827 [Lotus japonicus]|uniref:uncharacterized protein LOC130712827 n=1 Tax=Lotus japonicus TaxID=34305 RepID=UPI0025909CE9|nr:uncharacterized protein LOC130712827 [Lotus japonicus]